MAASLVIGDLLGRNPYWPPLAFNTSWPSNGDYSIKALCNPNDEICQPGGTGHEASRRFKSLGDRDAERPLIYISAIAS